MGEGGWGFGHWDEEFCGIFMSINFGAHLSTHTQIKCQLLAPEHESETVLGEGDGGVSELDTLPHNHQSPRPQKEKKKGLR